MERQMESNVAAVASQSLVRPAGRPISLKKRLRITDEIVRYILLFCGILSIFTTTGIVYVLGGQALLFFDSRAYVLAKTPVINEEVQATFAESIRADDRVLLIEFQGDRVPFANQQYLTVGEEIMQVRERGRRTITVERGMLGTEATTHPIEDTIFGMVDSRIHPTEEVSPEDTTILLEEGFTQPFSTGDLIRLGGERGEVMRITGIEGDTLTVERGVQGTEAEVWGPDNDIELADEVTITEFLTGTKWQPQIGDFGIWPLMLSTLMISLIAMLVAVPLGLGAAIYLSEYAPRNVRNVIKPMLEVLAGIPTVVFGFFALTLVTPVLRTVFTDLQFQNMLSAGIVVGILLIPYISSFSEDALSAVPSALREASFGLGATKLETTVKVVLPAAVSGIAAAFILAMSRAVGETMIVAIAAGSGPNFTFNVFEGAETMTGHIARISGGDLSYNSIDYNSIFSIGLMLFLMTLLLNLFSTWITNRLREEY